MKNSNRFNQNEAILNFAQKVTSILQDNLGKNLIATCLFGSAVKRNLRKGSDIDILTICKTLPKSYHKRTKIIVPLLESIRSTQEYKNIEKFNLYLEPSFLILSVQEIEKHPPILIDLSEEGIILYDCNNFLKRHLQKINDRLKRIGTVKKVVPGGYYWILKPDIKVGEVFEL
jgi:predicted nucleotidyltransferase